MHHLAWVSSLLLFHTQPHSTPAPPPLCCSLNKEAPPALSEPCIRGFLCWPALPPGFHVACLALPKLSDHLQKTKHKHPRTPPCHPALLFFMAGRQLLVYLYAVCLSPLECKFHKAGHLLYIYSCAPRA